MRIGVRFFLLLSGLLIWVNIGLAEELDLLSGAKLEVLKVEIQGEDLLA